jgi:histidyl-tRNA synthetase
MQVIDKKDKVSTSDFLEMLEEEGVKEPLELVKVLESSFENLPELDEEGEKAKAFTREIKVVLRESGYYDFMKFDLSIARGLAYYTDTVFEVFDREQKFRAIAGGGAYENFVSEDSEKLDWIGFGMGDVVLSEVLKAKGLLPEYKKDIDYFIATIGNVESQANKIATFLRKDYKVELNLLDKGLSKQFDYANYIDAKKIIIVGERDLEQGLITIKDLESGKEKQMQYMDFFK